MKMQLFSHVESKHFLAACTLVGEGGTKLEHLVGDGLPIRYATNGKTRITLAAKYLEITEVDLEMRVLRQPTAFILDDEGKPDAVTPPALAATDPVKLEGGELTITLSANPNSDLEIWAHVSGELLNETPAVKVTIAATKTEGSEPLVAPPGTYQVLLLITGKRIKIKGVTVP